ncbi:HlyD family type I secretion periplasmic adaptor subunit [Sphingomonas sp. HMWF008]|nr:HlyD family type I secretion periplasmic adaptor subunit [Sphingomonas sp. HMWF008]
MTRSLEDVSGDLKPGTASNILLWVVVAIVVLLFGWAAIAKVDRTVRGMGRVIPSSQLQVVSNLEGGVVQRILVRSGASVTRGQPLILLDPTQSSGDFGSGQASTGALQLKIARLLAEVQGREPVYPAGASVDQVAVERALHDSRMADLNGLTSSAQARLAQANAAVTEAEYAYRSRAEQRDARAEEVRVLRPLVEHGVEPRMSLLQATSAADTAASDASSAFAAIGRARQQVAEARAMLGSVRQNWRAAAATELASAQADLGARSSLLPTLERKVERTVVRAPLAGRVNRMLVTTAGSAIQPGQPLAEIVPSQDSLLIEALFRPQDISSIAIGQRVAVSLTAYDRSIYGTIPGSVVSISPDTIEREKGGETAYLVRVRTNRTALRDASGTVRPIGVGMVAEVDVLGDKRTVLQYILSPITEVSDRAFQDK